jgi:hypothetical protein
MVCCGQGTHTDRAQLRRIESLGVGESVDPERPGIAVDRHLRQLAPLDDDRVGGHEADVQLRLDGGEEVVAGDDHASLIEAFAAVHTDVHAVAGVTGQVQRVTPV